MGTRGLSGECVLRITNMPLKATKWDGFSELLYKKVGPVSVLGRARERTLRNVYGVFSPTVGSTFLLQSDCTAMCRHIYDRNIVDCDVKPSSPNILPMITDEGTMPKTKVLIISKYRSNTKQHTLDIMRLNGNKELTFVDLEKSSDSYMDLSCSYKDDLSNINFSKFTAICIFWT